jgi:hypothetical protein
MASRTWKIGEYAKGGVITVDAMKTRVSVIGKEWDMDAGSTRGSDQSNAKEFTRLTVNPLDSGAEREVEDFLLDLTTSYYTDEIMKWIRSKTAFDKNYGYGRNF